MQNTACHNNGADSVWTHSNLTVKDMKSSLQYSKGSLNNTAGYFVRPVEILLLFRVWIHIWGHQEWHTSITTVPYE